MSKHGSLSATVTSACSTCDYAWLAFKCPWYNDVVLFFGWLWMWRWGPKWTDSPLKCSTKYVLRALCIHPVLVRSSKSVLLTILLLCILLFETKNDLCIQDCGKVLGSQKKSFIIISHTRCAGGWGEQHMGVLAVWVALGMLWSG